MAGELTKEHFGVNTDFGSLSSTKKPSNEDVFSNAGDAISKTAKAGAVIAEDIGEGNARDAATDFLELDIDEEAVIERKDLLSNEINVAVQNEKLATGADPTEERIKVLKARVLNRVSIGQRSIQAAIDSGVMTLQEGEARARLIVQRESNRLDASFFKGDIQDALADLTGAGSGSPAFAFRGTVNDMAADQQKQLKATTLAQRQGRIHVYEQPPFAYTSEQAAEQVDYEDREAQREVVRKREEAARGRTSAQIIQGSAERFTVASRALSIKLQPHLREGVRLDPIVKRQYKEMEVDRMNEDRQRMLDGNVTADDLKLFDDRMDKHLVRVDAMLDLADKGKLTEEQIKITDNLAKLNAVAAFPDVHQASQISETFGNFIATMNKQQKDDYFKLIGVNPKDWNKFSNSVSDLAQYFLNVKLGGGNPYEGFTEPEITGIQALMATMSEEGQATMIDEMSADGADVDEIYERYDTMTTQSLLNNAGGTDRHVRTNNPTAAKINVTQQNAAVDNYQRYLRFRKGQNIPIEIIQNVNRGNPRGALDPESIQFHKDLAPDMKELIKRSYRSLKNSRNLWQDDFDTAAEALEAMYNQGFKFSAEEFTGRIKKGTSTNARGQKTAGGTLEPRTVKGTPAVRPTPTQEQLDDLNQEIRDEETGGPDTGAGKKSGPKHLDFSTTPDSDGGFDKPSFATWREVYNTEKQKTPEDNEREAQNVIEVLNNSTPEQATNINTLEGVMATLGKPLYEHKFKGTVDWNEVTTLMKNTFAAETSAGTILNNTKSNAAGWMQIMPDTAQSLIDNHQFSKDAALATGFDIKAYEALTTAEEKSQMLADNTEANILFALAKYLEQKGKLK